MMIRTTTLMALLCLVLSCQPSPQGFLTIEGWSPLGKPATYDADGLWELINGAADTFLSYGFESVTVQNYRSGDVTASVAVYDMGTPLNAFGIYRTESQGADGFLEVGTEAVVSPPYQCLLLKGRNYVKVDAYEGDIDQATGESLVAAMAGALPGGTGLPPEFASLPSEGMEPGSARYSREDAFGLAELDECIHAAYRDENGEQYQAFVVLTPDPETRERVWTDLSDSWQTGTLGDRSVLFREVPYSGLVGVIRTDQGLVGVAEAPDEPRLMERLDRLAAD